MQEQNNCTWAFEVDSLDAFIFRAPLEVPRRNAFGVMKERPALAVRLRDRDGVEGWGEAFCNWPSFAAEYRFRVVTELLRPLTVGREFASPSALHKHLNARVHALRIQCDDRGAFDHSIAAVDIAAWDLVARRLDRPLYEVLGDRLGYAEIPVYAGAITAENLTAIVERHLACGVGAFKLKVGFGLEHDCETLARLRSAVGDGARLMIDANQAWNPIEALANIRQLAEHNLDWVEEPIAADTPLETWRKLADASPVPLAAGENVRGHQDFEHLMCIAGVRVVQPDPIKWGGVTDSLKVGRSVLSRNARYRFCPHYLGGGIGLVAVAHLLAATGGDGILELDGSENLLREYLASPYPDLRHGALQLSREPGLGVTPDWHALAPLQVAP